MNVSHVMHTPSGGRRHFRRVVVIEGRKTSMYAPPPQSALWLVWM